MKIVTSESCQECLLSKFRKNVSIYEKDEANRALEEFEEIVHQNANQWPSPWFSKRGKEILMKYFNAGEDYEMEKKHFNNLLLSLQEDIEVKIMAAQDPLKKAISYCLAGNYIDYSAVKDVKEEKLFELLEDPLMNNISSDTLKEVKKKLEDAKKLVLLSDNCGEIVLDKLLIKLLSRQYPSLNITVIVRGEEILNDATLKDAQEIGLTEICRCISNGTGYASTIFSEISKEAREAIEEADLIISKGQGNLEGFLGTGFPTYYLFLVKCDYFVRRFKKERFTPVFASEEELIHE